MTLDTNDSIRYLMNEMDPSEAIHYERQLEENPDVRIDLESMRRSTERLQAAPSFSAPSHVLSEIVSFASHKALHRQRLKLRKMTLQAAAVLTLALVPSLYFLSDPTQPQPDQGLADSNEASPWVDENQNIKLAVTGVNTPVNSQSSFDRPASANIQQFRGAAPTFFLTLESAQATDQTAGVLDSIYKESFQKLRPIQQSIQVPSASRDLQLTGSARN